MDFFRKVNPLTFVGVIDSSSAEKWTAKLPVGRYFSLVIRCIFHRAVAFAHLPVSPTVSNFALGQCRDR
jgi:hypothetical protein